MRRLAWALALLAGAGVALLLLALAHRVEVAQAVLDRALAALLPVPAQVVVERVEARTLVLGGLEVGGAEGLRAQRIAVAYSLGELLRGRLDAVEVAGVRLRLAVDESGRMDWGPLSPLFAEPEGDATTPGPLVLPAPRIRVEDVAVHVDTSRGPVEVAARASVAQAGGDTRGRDVVGEVHVEARHEELGGEAEARLSGPLDALVAEITLRPRLALPGVTLAGRPVVQGRVSLGDPGPRGHLEVPPLTLGYRHGELVADATTPALRLDFAADGEALSLEARGSGGRVSVPGYGVEGLSLSLRSDGARVDGTLGVERIVDTARPPLFAPLRAEAKLAGPLEDVGVQAVVRGPEDHLVVHVDARVATAGDGVAARGRYHSEPLRLGSGHANFARLFPSLARRFGRVSGQVSALGTLSLRDGAPRGTVDLALEGVDAVGPSATLRAVNGTLAFEGPDPIVSRGDQLLSIGLVEAGLPLTDGLVRFRLLPGMLLDVPAASFQVAGGEVRSGVRMDLDEDDFEVVLVALSLDVARLLESVQLDGLSGSGTISGALPIEVGRDHVAMRDARLRGDPPGGTLRYRPDAAARQLAKRQAASLGVAVDALSDLRWEVLELSLDGDTAGVMQIGLRVSGSNPEFREGHPVQFNLNVEARLADLVRAGIESYRVPEAIEERLRRFGEQREGRGAAR